MRPARRGRGPGIRSWCQKHAATIPPGAVTRAISRSPAVGSFMNTTTRLASAASNSPSAKGRLSAAAWRMSAPGLRLRHASTNGGVGSTAATWCAPLRRTSSTVRPPGPVFRGGNSTRSCGRNAPGDNQGQASVGDSELSRLRRVRPLSVAVRKYPQVARLRSPVLASWKSPSLVRRVVGAGEPGRRFVTVLCVDTDPRFAGSRPRSPHSPPRAGRSATAWSPRGPGVGPGRAVRRGYAAWSRPRG